MRQDRETGISAIEVLVAASILAIALLAIASMFPTAYSNVDRSGEETTAVALAQQQIEWLRTWSYTSANLAVQDTTAAVAGYAGYTRRTQIVDDAPVTDVKRLTVTATTPSGRKVALITLIAK